MELLQTAVKLHASSLQSLTVKGDGTLVYCGNNGAIASCFEVSLPSLKHLDLDLNDSIGQGNTAPELGLPKVFENLQKNAPLLENLRILAIPIGEDKVLGLDKVNFPRLHSLELSGYDIDSAEPDLAVETVRLAVPQLAKSFPNLRKLGLFGTWVPLSTRGRQTPKQSSSLSSLLPTFKSSRSICPATGATTMTKSIGTTKPVGSSVFLTLAFCPRSLKRSFSMDSLTRASLIPTPRPKTP